MTKPSLPTLRSLTATTFFVVLGLAGIFYQVDVPRRARAAILSQLDYEVYCLSLGGVTPRACAGAE